MDGFLEIIGFFSCLLTVVGLIIGSIWIVRAALDNRDAVASINRQLNDFASDRRVNTLSERMDSIERRVNLLAKPKGR